MTHFLALGVWWKRQEGFYRSVNLSDVNKKNNHPAVYKVIKSFCWLQIRCFVPQYAASVSSDLSVVLSTCLLVLPFCSTDYEIITEICIVLEEIGGLSPGVMFKGPSLHWSALNHWFLPSLSPISSLSATLPGHQTSLATLQCIKKISKA